MWNADWIKATMSLLDNKDNRGDHHLEGEDGSNLSVHVIARGNGQLIANHRPLGGSTKANPSRALLIQTEGESNPKVSYRFPPVGEPFTPEGTIDAPTYTVGRSIGNHDEGASTKWFLKGPAESLRS